MDHKKLLFIGFGDIAQRIAKQKTHNYRMIGIARRDKSLEGVEFWQGDIKNPSMIAQIRQTPIDAVVVTLSPDGRTEADYRQTYVEITLQLSMLWQGTKAPYVIYVSSSGVYHQSDGQWVDESSDAEPSSAQGSCLLEAEANILAMNTPCSIVRFTGIYGPGRYYLLRDVELRRGGSEAFTNRIHADDAAAMVNFLLAQHFAGTINDALYLGTDDEPARASEVRVWLAEQMGYDPQALSPSISTRGGNKRCSNRRIKAQGFNFKYPSYREGYPHLIERFKAQ